jgi:acyl carrier protein
MAQERLMQRHIIHIHIIITKGMSMEIKENIQSFFEENFMVEFPQNFSDADSFLEIGIIDSTGVLELILFLEETYNFKVEDDEVTPENLDSFQALNIFIKLKLNHS